MVEHKHGLKQLTNVFVSINVSMFVGDDARLMSKPFTVQIQATWSKKKKKKNHLAFLAF